MASNREPWGLLKALPSQGVFIVAALVTVQGGMTVGRAIGVMQLASLPLSVFGSLGQSWASIQQNLAASRRLLTAMEISVEPVEQDAQDAVALPVSQDDADLQADARFALDAGGPESLHPVTHAVVHPGAPYEYVLEFDSVTFGYEPGKPVLQEASFRLKENEKAALVRPERRRQVIRSSGSSRGSMNHWKGPSDSGEPISHTFR